MTDVKNKPNPNQASTGKLEARIAMLEAALRKKETVEAELRQSEARETHIKQILLAVRNVNQLIVRENNPQRLIKQACLNLTETMGYFNAWIALLDDAGTTMIMVAESGFDGDFEKMGRRLARGEFPGCMRRAIECDEIIVTENPQANCPDCLLAAEYRGRAGFSLRLHFGGKVYGILSVSVPAEYAYDTEEQALFNELAGDLAFALHKIEMEERNRVLEEERKHLLDSMINAFVIFESVFDAQGRFISYRFNYINAAYERITGVTLEQVRGKTVHEVWPQTEPAWIENYGAVAVSGQPRTFEMFHQPTGKLYHCTVYRPWLTPDRFCVVFEDITERKQVEAALQTSKQIIEGIMNMLPIRVFWKDENLVYLGCNTAFAHDAGFADPKDIIGKDDYQMGWRDQAELYRNDDHQVIESGCPKILIEEPQTTPAGSTITLLTSKMPLRNPEWKINGVLGMYLDITERKQAEETLQHSRAMLARTERIAHVGSWEWEAATDTVTWSEELYHIFQRDPAGKAPSFAEHSQLYHPQDMARLNEAMQTALRTGDPYELELHAIRTDGETRVCLARGYSEAGPDGTVTRLFGSLQDITELKQVEKALRKSEKELQLTLNATTDGIWQWNFLTGELFFSDTWYRMLGYEPGEFPASYENWLRLIHPADLKNTLTLAETYLKTKPDVYENEFRLRTKDGGYKWVHSSAKVAERDELGRAIRLIGCHRDITARKRAEEALKLANTRLEALWNIASLVDADFKTICDHILATLVQMTASNYGFYGFMNEDESVMTIHTWSGEAMENCRMVVKPQRFPVSQAGVWAEAVRQRAPLIINDYAAEHPAKKGYPAGHVTLTNLLVVPFFVRDQIVTVAAVANRASDYTQNDVTQITTFLTGIQLIIQRMKAEETLRQSEERYNLAIRAANDGIFDWNLKTNQIVYSPRWKSMLGYAEDEIKNKFSEWERLTKPEDVKRSWEILHELLEGKRDRFEAEFKMRHKQGHWVDILARANAIRDETGAPIRVVGTHVDITDRKRAEEALRNRENFLQKIFDILPIGLWFADKNGKLLKGNPAGIKIWGAEPQVAPAEYGIFKARRLPSGEEIAPDDWALAHTIREGTTITDELLEIDAFDGTKKIILNYSAPVLDDQGNIEGAIVVNHDITHRERAEEALRESEERFRVLIESAPVSVLIMRDGKYIFGNPQSARLLGCNSPDDIIGLDVMKTISPEFHELIRQRIRHTDENMENTPAEIKLLRLNGETLWATSTSVGVVINGKPATLIVGQDITDRKRAEEALRESEQRFREVLENTLHAPYRRDLAVDAYDYISPTFFRLTGYTTKELMVMPLDEYVSHIHPDDLNRVLAFVNESMTSANPPHYVDYRFLHKDGQYRWLGDLSLVAKDTAGKPRYRYGSVQDITDRKHAEEEREKLQAQLIQAQKMESVGRLAGGVAHDFNNMLSVILGHAELAIRQVNPWQPIHADLEEIRKAAQRSADLTRQLLAFARKQAICPRLLDLNDTLASMLKMLQRLIGEDINLIWKPGNNLWPVMIDPTQVDQILANLAVNARDAIAGVGSLIIETENVTPDAAYCAVNTDFIPGDYVLLAVSDTGSGMNKETLEHLFEPFFTTKEVGRGTGLGLATIYGIVKQNNGYISVYSEPDQGTTFKIHLPRFVSEETPTQSEKPADVISSGTETILLVEDEPAILEMTRMMLEEFGYRVLSAGTPGKAIRLARDHAGEIHLLMTDVVMPGMNGRALAGQLLPLYPALKCLFMSGYTADIIAHRGIADEGAFFIQKPFCIKELISKIHEILDPKN